MAYGVIFDFDGVMADSMKLLARVEAAVLKEFGVEVSTEEIMSRFAGYTDRDFFVHYIEKHGLGVSWVELSRQKALLVNQRRLEIEPVDGALDLISLLFDHGFLLAIGSGSSKAYVQSFLQRYELERFFSAVVTADDVRRGKPDPETFLQAADQLGLSPSACTVIEDGTAGMVAARAAGMRCIGLQSAPNGPADRLVSSLSELSLKDFVSA